MKSLDEVKSEYPLHWQIWNGNVEELQQQLQTEQVCSRLGGLVGLIAHRILTGTGTGRCALLIELVPPNDSTTATIEQH